MHRFVFALASISMFAFTLPGMGGVQQAAAQDERRAVSQCQAIAKTIPEDTFGKVHFASFSGGAPVLPVQRAAEEVRITYVTHSTYLIETPGGVSIATDFNGWAGSDLVPRVVTMNKAHTSHYTLNPDPAIEVVLPGWNPEGGPADHDLVVGDTYIRNVTTDIRGGFSGMEADANSIFIFEVAGLCIGHLGHLHHVLENKHYAEIGRLDIVMVPVDGGYTMGADRMGDVVARLRSSIILPMHRFRSDMSAFLAKFDESFAHQFSNERGFTVSLRSLPKRPTILVLKGV